jgi:hypothetical protein
VKVRVRVRGMMKVGGRVNARGRGRGRVKVGGRVKVRVESGRIVGGCQYCTRLFFVSIIFRK